jgi:hypothetical protein
MIGILWVTNKPRANCLRLEDHHPSNVKTNANQTLLEAYYYYGEDGSALSTYWVVHCSAEKRGFICAIE